MSVAGWRERWRNVTYMAAPWDNLGILIMTAADRSQSVHGPTKSIATANPAVARSLSQSETGESPS